MSSTSRVRINPVELVSIRLTFSPLHGGMGFTPDHQARERIEMAEQSHGLDAPFETFTWAVQTPGHDRRSFPRPCGLCVPRKGMSAMRYDVELGFIDFVAPKQPGPCSLGHDDSCSDRKGRSFAQLKDTTARRGGEEVRWETKRAGLLNRELAVLSASLPIVHAPESIGMGADPIVLNLDPVLRTAPGAVGRASAG